MRGKGLPCLQIRVGSITKSLQPPLDVLSRNAKLPQFSGTNSVVQNSALLCFTVHWHRIDLTFVGSSPPAGTCGATWMFLLPSCIWPLLLSGRFSGSFHRSLDRLLTFSGSEGSSNVVLCTIQHDCSSLPRTPSRSHSPRGRVTSAPNNLGAA